MSSISTQLRKSMEALNEAKLSLKEEQKRAIEAENEAKIAVYAMLLERAEEAEKILAEAYLNAEDLL